MTKEERKLKENLEKEGKQIRSAIINLIDDIFDHYSEYTAAEIITIKNHFKWLEKTNKILDKYDIKKEVKRKGIIEVLTGWWNNITGRNN